MVNITGVQNLPKETFQALQEWVFKTIKRSMLSGFQANNVKKCMNPQQITILAEPCLAPFRSLQSPEFFANFAASFCVRFSRTTSLPSSSVNTGCLCWVWWDRTGTVRKSGGRYLFMSWCNNGACISAQAGTCGALPGILGAWQSQTQGWMRSRWLQHLAALDDRRS